jgi:hypothetical protein
VAHVVGAELYLITLFGRAIWGRHDTSIVNE